MSVGQTIGPKESKQDNSLNIVFTENELKTLNVKDMAQLSYYVPSMSIPAYGSRLTSSTYVRGIGSRSGNPAVWDSGDG